MLLIEFDRVTTLRYKLNMIRENVHFYTKAQQTFVHITLYCIMVDICSNFMQILSEFMIGKQLSLAS